MPSTRCVVRRAQVAKWTLLANRVGYLFFAVAIARFVIGFAIGFTGALVAIAGHLDGRRVRSPGPRDRPRLCGQGGRADDRQRGL